MRLFNLIVHALNDILHGHVNVEVEATVTVEKPAPLPAKPLEVEIELDKLTREYPLGGLDWRHSIVDLLKLLGIDSGSFARRALARELGYTGQIDNLSDGMARLNIWLHGEVLRRLRDRGIPLPQG